jgi:hypothetical protein
MQPIEWSEEGRADLFMAFHKAQSEMGSLIKGSVNPAFKSKYADLATVLETVLPTLNKNGLAVIQSPSFDGEVLSVETVIFHVKGGWIKSVLSMRPTKQDPQGIGSAETYCRRYAILALAGVAPEDDDGNAASAPGEAGQKFKSPRSESAAVLAAFAVINGLEGREQFAKWKADNAAGLKQLPQSDSDAIIRHFNERFSRIPRENILESQAPEEV